jgi:hypothetical protein
VGNTKPRFTKIQPGLGGVIAATSDSSGSVGLAVSAKACGASITDSARQAASVGMAESMRLAMDFI